MKIRFLLVTAFLVSSAYGQLTTDQKVQDLQNLASLYAKQYAPYGWKLQLFQYDLFNLAPWIDKVKKTTDDLSFYEVMEQYVASLNDIHSSYYNSSDFEAYLGFRCDIYDGKVIVDFINRAYLPAKQYPFQVGDQLLSVDGQTVDKLIQQYSSLVAFANPRSTQRYAAGMITDRLQYEIPKAALLGDTATVVILRQSGATETYTMTWQKFGTPLLQNGPVPSLRSAAPQVTKKDADPLFWKHPARDRLQVASMKQHRSVRGIGQLAPIFNLPAGFKQRLGRSSADFYFSGTYQSAGKTIGFIRLADFEPVTDFNLIDIPESQLDRELAYMEKNTDGLVIDVMHNPGGFACYAEDVMSRFATQPFNAVHLAFRPLYVDVQSFTEALQSAPDYGAEQWEIDVLTLQTTMITSAYKSNRGMTGGIPICVLSDKRDPNTDVNGNLAIYDKPILLLTDEFTISAGDLFSALFQDAARGKLFGWRTSGAGGTIFGYNTGFFSEGNATVTQTLDLRPNPVVSPDYPTAPLIENIGVRPESSFDYMTLTNLLQSGKPFTDAFTAAILSMIQ